MKLISNTFAVLVVIGCASLASAQQTETPLLVSAPSTLEQRPAVVVIAPPGAPTVAPAFWELISGYEGDTDGSGYGFFGPSYVRAIRPGLSWTARASGNYLSYQFSGLDGATRVRSPGVNSALGLQFGDKNFFRALAGPEIKWRRTTFAGAGGNIDTRTDTRVGANVGGELYANPASHSNIQGIVNYGTSDRYSWGRLGYKEQINNHAWNGPNTTFLGIEAIGQGNHDIRSRQLGGFFEITHVPAKVSIVLKAGYKRSTFNAGPDKTGPYFSVGFYQRLN
jgi:hypothetical protein